MRNINTIIIHCSATKPSQDIGVTQIRKWHKRKGWSDVGYHIVIRRDGTLELGRPLNKIGAHCKGQNRYSIGICLIGGLDKRGRAVNNFTKKQFATLDKIVDQYAKTFNIRPKDIKGHRDFSPDLDGDGIISKEEWLKVCPCFEVKDWIAGKDLVTERPVNVLSEQKPRPKPKRTPPENDMFSL